MEIFCTSWKSDEDYLICVRIVEGLRTGFVTGETRGKLYLTAYFGNIFRENVLSLIEGEDLKCDFGRFHVWNVFIVFQLIL